MRSHHDHEILDRDDDHRDDWRRRTKADSSGNDRFGSIWKRGYRRAERDPQFGSDAYRGGLARDETGGLIASDKVEGTPVYDRNGRKLGSIYNLMLDKFSGEVIYAVVRNHSGFLGLDERYFPLDWCDLTYDTRVHGYGVGFTEDDLERSLSRDESRRRRMAERDQGYENYRPHFYW